MERRALRAYFSHFLKKSTTGVGHPAECDLSLSGETAASAKSNATNSAGFVVIRMIVRMEEGGSEQKKEQANAPMPRGTLLNVNREEIL